MRIEQIRPINANVLLRKKRQRVTAGGLHIPENARAYDLQVAYEVVAFDRRGQFVDIRDADLNHRKWEWRVPQVEVGEVVWLQYEGGGFEIRVEGEDDSLIMVDCSMIVAVVRGAEAGQVAA